MVAVNFYASRGNAIGKKLVRLDWEKAVCRPLFTLANTLIDLLLIDSKNSADLILCVFFFVHIFFVY